MFSLVFSLFADFPFLVNIVLPFSARYFFLTSQNSLEAHFLQGYVPKLVYLIAQINSSFVVVYVQFMFLQTIWLNFYLCFSMFDFVASAEAYFFSLFVPARRYTFHQFKTAEKLMKCWVWGETIISWTFEHAGYNLTFCTFSCVIPFKLLRVYFLNASIHVI